METRICGRMHISTTSREKEISDCPEKGCELLAYPRYGYFPEIREDLLNHDTLAHCEACNLIWDAFEADSDITDGWLETLQITGADVPDKQLCATCESNKARKVAA